MRAACRAGRATVAHAIVNLTVPLLALWGALNLHPCPGDLGHLLSPLSGMALNRHPPSAARLVAAEVFCVHLSARSLALSASPPPHPSTPPARQAASTRPRSVPGCSDSGPGLGWLASGPFITALPVSWPPSLPLCRPMLAPEASFLERRNWPSRAGSLGVGPVQSHRACISKGCALGIMHCCCCLEIINNF